MNLNVFLVTVILLSVYIVRTRTNEIVLNDVHLKISDENSQGVYSDNTNNNIQSFEDITLKRINLRKRDVLKHTISRRSVKTERVSRSAENHFYPSSPPPRDSYPRVQSSNSKPNYPHGYNLSYAEVRPSHHPRDSASLKQNIPHNVNASYPSSPKPTSPRFNSTHRLSNNPHNSNQKENSTHAIHSYPSSLQNLSSTNNNISYDNRSLSTVPTMFNRTHLTTPSRFNVNNSPNFGNNTRFNNTNSRLEPINLTTTLSLPPFTSSYSISPQYFSGDLTTEKSKVEFISHSINNTTISPFTSKPLFLNITTHLNSSELGSKPISFTTPTHLISSKPAYPIFDTSPPSQLNNTTFNVPNPFASYPVNSTPLSNPYFPVSTPTSDQIKPSNSLPLYLPNVLLSYPPEPQIVNNTQGRKDVNNFSSNTNTFVPHVNNNISLQIFPPNQSFSNQTFINNQNEPFIQLEIPKTNYPPPTSPISQVITEIQPHLIPSNLIPSLPSSNPPPTVSAFFSPNNTQRQPYIYPQSLNVSNPLTNLPLQKLNDIQNQPQSYWSNQNPNESWTLKPGIAQNHTPIVSYQQMTSLSTKPNSAQSQPHSYPPSLSPYSSNPPPTTPWSLQTSIQQNRPHTSPQSSSPFYPQTTLSSINLSSSQNQPHSYPSSQNLNLSTTNPLPILPWTPILNISQNQPHIYPLSLSPPYPITTLPSKNPNTVYNQPHSYPSSSTFQSSTSSPLSTSPWIPVLNISQNQPHIYPQNSSPPYPLITLPSKNPNTNYNQSNSSNSNLSTPSPLMIATWTSKPSISQNQPDAYQQSQSPSYPQTTLPLNKPINTYNPPNSYPLSSNTQFSTPSSLSFPNWTSAPNILQNQSHIYPQSLSPLYPQTTLSSKNPNPVYNQSHSYPPSSNTHSSTTSPLPIPPRTIISNIQQYQPHIYPQSPSPLYPQTTLPSISPQPHSYPPSSNPYSSTSTPLATAPWTPKPNMPQNQAQIYPQSPSPTYLLTTLPSTKSNTHNQPHSYPSTPKSTIVWPKDILNITSNQPHSYPPSPKTTTSFMTTTSIQQNPTIKNSKLKNSSSNIYVTNIVTLVVGLNLLRLFS